MRTHGKNRYHLHNALEHIQVAYARATLGLGIDSIMWSAMHDASMSLLQVDWLHAKLPSKNGMRTRENALARATGIADL